MDKPKIGDVEFHELIVSSDKIVMEGAYFRDNDGYVMVTSFAQAPEKDPLPKDERAALLQSYQQLLGKKVTLTGAKQRLVDDKACPPLVNWTTRRFKDLEGMNSYRLHCHWRFETPG